MFSCPVIKNFQNSNSRVLYFPQVAQLAGYVAEQSAYHHGEQSLNATIVGMAQDFVGSNNINVLDPIGMFGTRAQVVLESITI